VPIPDPRTVAAAQRRAASTLLEFAPVLDDVARRFTAAGHEISLVGGPVRDAMLGRLHHQPEVDLDLTTDARPERILELVQGWADTHWDIGREYGTIGARKGGFTVEITTYRSDAYDPTSRKPVVAFGNQLEGDLSRRDFTINAMAVRLPELTFVDPFGGMADVAAGVLRTPVTAQQSFSDDPLRMMRAARFVAQLGFEVDPGTRAAMAELAGRIQIVSAERIQAELCKLVTGRHPRRGLELMVETGLAEQVLPELPGMQLTIDEHHRHKDVYEHSLTVLDQAIALETGPDGPVPGPDLVLRLAALLHDIGKPSTRRFEGAAGVSFHHHEVVGAKLAARRLKELRFDKETTRAVARLVELHLRFHGYGTGEWTDSAVRRYITDAGPLLERLHRLTRADCTTRNQRKAARLAATYDDLERRISALQEAEQLAAVRPDLDGGQIMALLGVAPGKVVGRAYGHLLELRMERGPLGPERAGAELRAWWAEQPEQAAPDAGGRPSTSGAGG